MDKVTIGQLYPARLQPFAPVNAARRPQHTTSGQREPFQEILQQKLLQFSNHAKIRLQQRGITLRTEQLEQLCQAIDKAAAKGAKESLVLMKDIALIVNVPNRTVVTAMDEAAMTEHVFTQIDSAIIVKS